MIIDNSPGGSFNTSGPGKKGKNPLVLREAFKKKKTKKVDICHLRGGGGKIF